MSKVVTIKYICEVASIMQLTTQCTCKSTFPWHTKKMAGYCDGSLMLIYIYESCTSIVLYIENEEIRSFGSW